MNLVQADDKFLKQLHLEPVINHNVVGATPEM